LGPQRSKTVLETRAATHAVLDREDDRLLVVVGPCSVHDVDATREYARRLREQAQRLQADLLVTMRVYFEKPRTTTGWKGLINDPHLDGSGDVNTGLRLARGLLLEVLALGLPVGCEFLDPIIPQYISDAVSWGAIGARTVESQTHRQLGSGLSMPVGFKNRTDGNVQVAVDAVRAAAVTHAFAGIDPNGTPSIVYTRGNRDCHVILRGGSDGPNYAAAAVAQTMGLLRAGGLPERLMIDCSHDNSRKDAPRQVGVAADISEQIAAGNRAIAGTMLESFLVGGRQELDPSRRSDPAQPRSLTYGQSITDACLDWDSTVEVLDALARAVRSRRDADG
jgi:3-deoxy-7-phosphoheptulonate synthase